MNIYAISDLHLSFEVNKPMNIFNGWDNYVERLSANWKHLVNNEDLVVLPGDFSWGLKIEETLKDFKFLDVLPGKKILIKGNHDLWWSTAKKIREFFAKNDIKTVDFIFNSYYPVGDYAICGTRGWIFEDKLTDEKIILREASRLNTSINTAKQSGLIPIVFLHYPPVYKNEICKEIFSVLKEHKIQEVYYGHIHGLGVKNAQKEYDGIKMHLVSCDTVNFTPVFVRKILKI